MEKLTKKEIETIKAVIAPFLDSDFFEDKFNLPKGIKSQEEANQLLNSAYNKLN